MDPSEIDALVQRLVANPHDEEALGYAHRAGASDPKSYAMLLERVGGQTVDPSYAAHWLSEAANVWLQTLGEAHRAARVLMMAIDKDPTQPVAAERLAQLYREKGDVRALVALLDRRAKALAPLVGQDPQLRADVAGMHEELGRLWNEAPLSQPKKALEHFKRAIELDPQSAYAIYSGRELLKSQGQFDEAYSLYDAELQLEQDPSRKAAILRDEAATRRSAGDLVGATRALAKARQIDDQDPGLQQEYAASILDRMQAGEPVPQQERTNAAEMLVALAEVYDGEHGLAYAGAALDIEPGHDRALQLYSYYARTLQREEDLSNRYLAYVEASPSGTMSGEARQMLSLVYEGAGRFDEAIQVLEPLRATDPAAAQKLEELYTQTGMPRMTGGPSPSPLGNTGAGTGVSQPGTMSSPGASTHYSQPPPTQIASRPPTALTGESGPVSRASARPPAGGPLTPDKIQGILDAAQMLAGKGKKPEALAKYKEVLEADPAHPEALAWVEDYLRTKRDYGQLRDVLLASVRVMGSVQDGLESRKERLREVAGLCEGNLRDIDGAISAWKQLLALDRTDDSARQSLSRLLERSQRWDDLANLLEQEATVSQDVDTKIALEKKLANLNEQKRRDFGAAAEAWARIARLQPDDDRAVSTSAKLFEKAGRLDAAAQVIADNGAAVEDPAARGQLLERLAEIREQLGDVAGAGEAYADAAETGRSGKLWEDAERCFVTSEKWDRAANAAVQRGQLAGETKGMASHLARAAELYARAGDEASALEKLEHASDLDPTADDYASQLEARYTHGEKWDKLVEFLSRRGDRLGDRPKRVALRRQAAVLYAQKLGDKEQAREQWLKVLEDGDDREALERLIDYAVEREDHTEAATLLRRLGGIAIDKADKARVALREAELLAEGVGDVDTAIVRYESILSDLDATCRPALQAIADLQEARDNPAAAADALERELKLVADPQERGQIAARLARLYEQLDDPRAAIRALDIVRKADLEDFDALARLCELCEKVEQWDRVAELLAERIEVEGDEAEASVMTKKLAMILADKLDRGDEALAALTELADQGDTELRAAYVELGDRLGWKGIVASKLVEWWYEAKNGPERLAALRGAFDRFAAVGRDQDAARVAIEIVRAKGGDRALAQRLEELAVKTNDLDALSIAHDLLGKDAMGEPLSRAQELVRQAEVSARAGMPRMEAIQHGEAGLASISLADAEPLLERLAELAERANDVIELYERQVSRSRAPQDRVRALAKAAQVSAAKNQAERARGFYELAASALKIGSEGDEETLAVLEDSARDGDKRIGGEKLRRALCAALANGGGGARDGGRTRSALLRRAASIVHRELRDLDQAFGWLADALIAHVNEAALDAVEKLGVDVGDPGRAEHALTRALSEVFDGPLVRQLLARRAKLRREHLGDKPGAAADLKKLHDLSPTDQAVLDELSMLLRELGDYRGMVQLYEDQILRGKDMNTRAELARKVARMWEEQLQDPREAADAWRRVLRMKAGDDEATAGLERAKTNMLKKPDPNAGPDAYAPPRISAPPPPDRAPASIPPTRSSGNSVPPPATELMPTPHNGVASVDPSQQTAGTETPVATPAHGTLFETAEQPITVAEPPPETAPYPSSRSGVETGGPAQPPQDVHEETAPHAISMELIAAIRSAGKTPGARRGGDARSARASDEITANAPATVGTPSVEITSTTGPGEELHDPHDLHARTPEQVPVALESEDLLTSPGDSGPFHAASSSGGSASSRRDKPSGELGTTDEKPTYDFVDETLARPYHPDEVAEEIDVEADDIEIVDDGDTTSGKKGHRSRR